MIAITGATGHTGSTIAEKLVAKGIKIRVIGRDAQRLERFTQKGAERAIAEATDAEALERAFAGATAVYAMIPPNLSSPDVLGYQEKVSSALASAVQKNRVGHIVVLSSVGAEQPKKVGPVIGLHILEEKLKQIDRLNALFIRAGYFMENLLPQAGIIQGFGMAAGPVRADLPIPMIATRDISQFAAEALASLNFSGKQTHELLGPRDVTYDQIAKIIGTAIGKANLAYRQLPAAQLKPALMQIGLSSNMADLLLEMADSLNAGVMKPMEPRAAANTTPTTVETFIADTFLPAYRGKAAGA